MNKKIAGLGILLALTIVFTIISDFIKIGTISINLALIPVIVSGILYGPLAAFTLGLINGAFIMITAQEFFAISIVGTIVTCLVKTSLAALISTYIYKLIKNKNETVAVITASILIVLLNTTFFILLSLIFFNTTFGKLITIFTTINFAIEIVSTAIVAPSISKVIIYRRKEVIN